MTEITSGIGDLLQRLRKDGVQAGETEKLRIVSEAEEQARKLVASAEAQARAILSEAKAEVQAQRAQLEAELAMAARDFVLGFAQRAGQQVIQPLVQQRVGEVLRDPQALTQLLSALVSQQAGGSRVSVSPELRDQLADYFEHELAGLMQGGALEVRSEQGLKGFRLQREGDGFVWEVTEESVARELSALVEPALRKYLTMAHANRA